MGNSKKGVYSRVREVDDDEEHDSYLLESQPLSPTDSIDKYDDEHIPPSRSTCQKKSIAIAFILLILAAFYVIPVVVKSCSRPRPVPEEASASAEGGEEVVGVMEAVMEEGEDVLLPEGYKFVGKLPKEWLPGKGKEVGNKGKGRRLVFIGDVHGCLKELKKLLKKVEFNKKNDHVVFMGDMISRGKKSPEVVDYAIKLGASCVRGNHEDRVLRHRKKLQKGKEEVNETGFDSDSDSDSDSEDEGEKEEEPEFDTAAGALTADEKHLAKILTPKQVAYLTSCPLILRIGTLPYYHTLLAVHAGLVPNLPLKSQDPFSVMNMRSIDPTTGIPSAERDAGVHWARVWNEVMKGAKEESVVYGHFAWKGVDVRRWTTGLDGNCVRGGSLNALVVDGEGKGEVVGVDC